MNKGFIAFAAFSCGTIAGFFVGKKMLEQHYNQVVQEEIESVKQAFRKYSRSGPAKNETNSEKTDNASDSQNMRLIRNEKKDYRVYYDTGASQQKKTTKKDPSKIHVISPDEFDTMGYETISLKYYANGVVTDDSGEPMTNDEIENSITRESLNHFGEYEPDSVFVRNDDTRIDYEILMDEDEYRYS